MTITTQGTYGTAVVVDNNTAHPQVKYTAKSDPTAAGDAIKWRASDGA